VVAFDSTGHGDSGGPRPSFGVREKEDLRAVADWALARWPAPGGFVAHGESLGAASVLQYAALDPRLDAVVADCSFSDITEELDWRLVRAGAPRLLRRPAVAIVDRLVRRLEGYGLSAADPAAASLRSSVPVLFIHGSEDLATPPSMSERMAARRRELRPDAMTELRIVPEARHAASYNRDPAGYEEAVMDFVNRALARKATPPGGGASALRDADPPAPGRAMQP
jgi:fermentation-respiration switch protein FrsA (DUF1100 family)